MAGYFFKEWRKHRGLTQQELAARAGLSAASISQLERGNQGFSARSLERLAAVLECTVADFLSRPPAGARPGGTEILVRGTVQAGLWRPAGDWEAAEHDQYAEHVVIGLPDWARPRDVFALKVRGRSMDLIYPEGSVLVCAGPHALPGPIKSGDRVVIQRWNRAGEIEMTCKEIQQDAQGRIWLVPKSSQPEHQAPIPLPRRAPPGDTDGVAADDGPKARATAPPATRPVALGGDIEAPRDRDGAADEIDTASSLPGPRDIHIVGKVIARIVPEG